MITIVWCTTTQPLLEMDESLSRVKMAAQSWATRVDWAQRTWNKPGKCTVVPRLLTALLPRDHHGLQHLLLVNDLFLRLLLTQWFVRLSNTQNSPEKRSKNKLVCENTVAWPKGVARPLAKAVSYKKKLQFCKKKNNTKFLIGFRFNPKLKVATWFNNQCLSLLPRMINLVAYILIYSAH